MTLKTLLLSDDSARLAQTQVWPPLRNFEAIAASTAATRSASSKTMKDAFPPSSGDIFLSVGAHCPASSERPTRVLPVKLGLRTTGEAVSAPPMTSGRPVSTLNTPAGKPARSPRTQSASAEHGVKSDGSIAIVPPAERPVTEAAELERPGTRVPWSAAELCNRAARTLR